MEASAGPQGRATPPRQRRGIVFTLIVIASLIGFLAVFATLLVVAPPPDDGDEQRGYDCEEGANGGQEGADSYCEIDPVARLHGVGLSQSRPSLHAWPARCSRTSSPSMYS